MVSCGSYRLTYQEVQRQGCAYVAPVICELVRSRYRRFDSVNATSGTGRIHQELASAQKNFGRSRLSEREQEVVQLILRGHSIKSIAEKLGISCGTVKVHRKNIYVKLDVCSQSDLFSLFLSALGASLDTQANQGEDPLTVYWPRSTNHPRT
nr:LuxR C-terminal-related transcriptional regulator [Pseudomaricurvus alkylphenolicus]